MTQSKVTFSLTCSETKKRTHNKRFGNRLADGITIGYSSLSALVPADE